MFNSEAIEKLRDKIYNLENNLEFVRQGNRDLKQRVLELESPHKKGQVIHIDQGGYSYRGKATIIEVVADGYLVITIEGNRLRVYESEIISSEI